jgi:hypothetical protein
MEEVDEEEDEEDERRVRVLKLGKPVHERVIVEAKHVQACPRRIQEILQVP